MLQAKFVEHIKQNTSVINELTDELNQIIEEYPFFASAHLLLTKALYKQNSLQYSKQLRKTALVSNSRRVLYDYLHKSDVVEEVIKPSLIETETAQQPITEFSSKEDVKAITADENTDLITKAEIPSPVTITNNDVKIIYVTTVPDKATIQIPQADNEIKQQADAQEKEISESSEIELVQSIENSTQIDIQNSVAKIDSNTETNQTDNLNQQIENEIHKSIVQSYVEKEIIRTPELEKEESKEPVSFTDWLQKIKKEANTIQKVESKPKSEEKEAEIESNEGKKLKKPSFLNQNMQIIDKIIESDPGRIKLTSSKFYSPAIDSKQSLIENEHLVTETLAKIYALQGNISKAIRAYEILSLKFPQKSVYFASLIEKLKTNK